MRTRISIFGLAFVAIFLILGCAAKKYFIGYVTHGNIVTLLNVATNKIIDNLYVGQNPAWIKTAPDGRHIWVTNIGDFKTLVIDGSTGEIVKTMPMRHVVFKHQSPNYYVVSSEGVYEIDASNNETIISQISAQLPDAWHAVLTLDDRWLYVNHVFTDWMHPTDMPRSDYDYITLIDLKEKKIAKQIKVGSNPHDIKLTPNGRYVLTASITSNEISIVDTRINETVQSISVDQAPRGIAIRPDGKQLVLSCSGTLHESAQRNGELYLFETNFSDTLIVKLQKKIIVGGSPGFGSYTPDGTKLYFVDHEKNEVILVSPAALRISKRISLMGRPGTGIEIAFSEITKEARNNLMRAERSTRKLLKEILKNMKTQNPYIADLKITERYERLDPNTGKLKEQHAHKIYFRHPDYMKIVTKGMKEFLFNKGIPENVEPSMPMTTQRYILWAMHGMDIEETIKYLTGTFTDIETNPRSIAVDLIHSEEEDENDYYVIGAAENDLNVNQLWVDKSTWLPYRLIEAYPTLDVVRELRFMEYKKVEKDFTFPFLIEVYINGRLAIKEQVIESRPNSGLPELDVPPPEK